MADREVCGVRVVQPVNDLDLGSRWHSRGHGPERVAILRAVRVRAVPKGRRFYVFVGVESPPDNGEVTQVRADEFVSCWWKA